MSAQIIEKDGVPEFAVLPINEYETLVALAEDKVDAADVLDFREGKEETFPESVLNALLNGESPIKVYRKYRGMTQQELADAIGKSKIYIGKLEAGERTGSVEVLSKIAEVLEISLDQLVD